MDGNQWFLWGIAITQNLVASFIGAVLGILFTRFWLSKQDEKRYGRWHVIVKRTEEGKGSPVVLVDRAISTAKAKQVQNELSDLSVLLKGIVSPYGQINADLFGDAKEHDILTIDEANRRYILDLDHNPRPRGPICRYPGETQQGVPPTL